VSFQSKIEREEGGETYEEPMIGEPDVGEGGGRPRPNRPPMGIGEDGERPGMAKGADTA